MSTSSIVPVDTIPTSSASAQPQAAAAGLDVISNLLKARQTLDTQISAATQKALIPTAAPGPGTSPGLTMNAVPAFQPQPYINKPTAGARSTRDQGIANVIIGSANAVGAFETKKKQENQRVLAVDLERIFQAQQGITEAQQTLQVDPNNAAAKDTLQKNQNIINAMLSDPKRRKQIGKALDINFTDPSQNEGDEHEAFKQAVNSYSDQLNKAIPSNMQINPQAMNQLQLLQSQQKSVDEMIKAVAPAVIREQGAADREQMRENSQMANTMAKIQADASKAQAEMQARYKTAMAVAQTREDGAWARAQYAAQQGMNKLMTGIQMREQMRENRGLSPDKNLAAMQKSFQLAMQANQKATIQINALEQERDKIQSQKRSLGDAYPQVIDKYNKSLQFWEKQLGDSQDIMSSIEPKLKARGQEFTPDGTSNNSSESSTGSKSETTSVTVKTPVGQTSDDDDSEVDDSDLYGTGEDNSEQ